ncbi:hypothetical protein Tco_1479797 [Tanacetum coccineum]
MIEPLLAQVYKRLDEILKHSLVHLHGIQRNLQYWSANAQDLDPTYNVVQFKLYETKPLNPKGGLVKFELDLTAKKIPPEISATICVLMSLRFYPSGFISKVFGELMIIRKRKPSPEDLLDPHIATVEGYISGLKDSVHSIPGIANVASPLKFIVVSHLFSATYKEKCSCLITLKIINV